MKKDKTKVLAALTGGALLGAGIGVLFAPNKGSETRKKIKESFINLQKKVSSIDEESIQDYVNKKLDEIDREINKLELTNEYKKAKRQAKRVIKKIDKLISYMSKKGLDEFEDLIEDLKDKANDISEEILSNIEK